MENLELMKMFTEGISFEEIPTISNLEKIKDLILQSDFNEESKSRLLKNVQTLIEDTMWHSKAFTDMLGDLK